MKYKITIVVSFFLVIFIIVLGLKVYGVAIGPDTQCSMSHTTKTTLPSSFITAADYFAAGNYYYDIGNCQKAIDFYSQAIAKDKNVAQFYNNRAYTYMRLRDYKDALSDVDIAILLDPNYIQALLNRGDLYNYYGPIIDREKAITDYKKVISLGVVHNNSVCGHLAMAQTNNIIPLALLKLIFNKGYCK